MLFARSDVMSVAVPVTSGGCGASHSRPVVSGVPDPDWDLESKCPQCSKILRGDPLWSATLAEIPETYDERVAREDAEHRHERALKKAQEQTNVKLTDLNEQIVGLLRQQIRGPVPDEATIAEIVAREVAKALAQPVLPEPVPEPSASFTKSLEKMPPAAQVTQLSSLHVRTLGKMCRDRDLNDKGGKADLIARLTG